MTNIGKSGIFKDILLSALGGSVNMGGIQE